MGAKLKCLDVVLWAMGVVVTEVSRHEAEMTEPQCQRDLLAYSVQVGLGGQS